MSDLAIALVGGAVGTALAAALGLLGRAAAAWGTVTQHDLQAADLNRRLLAWVDDRTRLLVQQMEGTTNEMAARGAFHSGIYGSAQAEVKAKALHEYRDEEWRTRLQLEQLAAGEGGWHGFWRLLRRRGDGLELTAAEAIEPFLNRWREPITRHAAGPDDHVPIYDRTKRTPEDALRELPGLTLT